MPPINFQRRQLRQTTAINSKGSSSYPVFNIIYIMRTEAFRDQGLFQSDLSQQNLLDSHSGETTTYKHLASGNPVPGTFRTDDFFRLVDPTQWQLSNHCFC